MDDYKKIKEKLNLSTAILEDVNNFIEEKIRLFGIREMLPKMGKMDESIQLMSSTSFKVIETLEEIENKLKQK